MYLLISLFLFCIYPYSIYKFFTYNMNQKNKFNQDNLNITNKNYKVFINPLLTQCSFNECNPFCKDIKLYLFLTFEINSDTYDLFQQNASILSDKYTIINNETINKDYIEFKVYLTEKNNEIIKNMIKYIKLVYHTYSNIEFIYYDKYPYVYHWLRENLNEFNNDTTRNYYMLNIKNIIFTTQKNYLIVPTNTIDREIHDFNDNKLPELYFNLINNNKFIDFTHIIEELL